MLQLLTVKADSLNATLLRHLHDRVGKLPGRKILKPPNNPPVQVLCNFQWQLMLLFAPQIMTLMLSDYRQSPACDDLTWWCFDFTKSGETTFRCGSYPWLVTGERDPPLSSAVALSCSTPLASWLWGEPLTPPTRELGSVDQVYETHFLLTFSI